MRNLKILYKNKKLEKQCTNRKIAVQSFGDKRSDILFQRIQEIKSMDSVHNLVTFRIGRCHALKGDSKEQYAMDLDHPYRLILKKIENKIEIVKILEIVDYH